ncbi:hypothetical protein HRI_004192900 [Hibiscus trionum]|uniref:Prolamin-like domain-containing protein n=1 Tax=Hibiscus trionum TaxID=183268 RepID=A0A9W7J215_HIBTR|nr:hypothetical protein HRI_004192900 [Hibiscus trionum]
MANLNVHTALAILVMAVSGAVVVESLHAHAERCRDMLSLVCEDEVLTRIFLYRHTRVSHECCKEVVRMGGACLEVLVIRDLEDPFFENHTKFAHKIFDRAQHLWAKCTSLASP